MKYEILSEKFRPKRLIDIIGQSDIIERLQAYVRLGGFPNLMFSGPPGTGKTTSAICLALEFHGNLINFKEFNASDNRGIDVVRKEIKQYVSTRPIGKGVEFKIIFLDEADALTNDAQSALRRTMEKYTSTCKFILGCNYSTKIIEPIQSRCAVFRFKGISKSEMSKRLLYIADKEELILSDEVLDAINYISENDMRKAINSLETASLMGKNISIETIYKCSGMAHPDEIIRLLTLALKGNFKGSLAMLDILLIEQGYSSLDIINQIFREVINLNIIDKMKIDIINIIGDVEFRISEGANERIQMKYLIANLIKIGAS
jgi:replication factor C small subunit